MPWRLGSTAKPVWPVTGGTVTPSLWVPAELGCLPLEDGLGKLLLSAPCL